MNILWSGVREFFQTVPCWNTYHGRCKRGSERCGGLRQHAFGNVRPAKIRTNWTIHHLQNVVGVAGSLVGMARPLLDIETFVIKRPLDCRQGAYIVGGVGQTSAPIHQIRNEQQQQQ